MENPIIPPTRELKPRRGEKIKDEGQELMERKMDLHSNLPKTLVEFLSHSIYLFTCLALLLRAGDIELQLYHSSFLSTVYNCNEHPFRLLFFLTLYLFLQYCPFRILTVFSEKLMLFFIQLLFD